MAGSLIYRKLLDDAWDLHIRKNAGYAGADNPDPWANFRMAEDFGISAFEGCLVRMTDKYARIRSLRKNPDNDQVNESIRDTLQDLAAYALIAICLLDEEKNTAVLEPFNSEYSQRVWGTYSTPMAQGTPHARTDPTGVDSRG